MIQETNWKPRGENGGSRLDGRLAAHHRAAERVVDPPGAGGGPDEPHHAEATPADVAGREDVAERQLAQGRTAEVGGEAPGSAGVAEDAGAWRRASVAAHRRARGRSGVQLRFDEAQSHIVTAADAAHAGGVRGVCQRVWRLWTLRWQARCAPVIPPSAKGTQRRAEDVV